MFNNKVKFWFLYFISLISVQMFFFGIYNIPIYKLYCEINNYYSFSNLNNFLDDKICLYKNDYFSNDNYFFNTSFRNFNFFYHFDDFLNFYDFKYIINNIYNIPCNYNIYLNFFYLDFIIYNIFNIFVFFFYEYENNINIDNIVYVVYFSTSVTNINIVEFISLQDHIYIYTSETYLVFFRLYNPSNFLIKGISIYTINPNDVNAYVYKIQCFCFDEMVLYGFESVDLPILFYISSNINNYLNFESLFFFQIQIVYLFILNSFKI